MSIAAKLMTKAFVQCKGFMHGMIAAHCWDLDNPRVLDVGAGDGTTSGILLYGIKHMLCTVDLAASSAVPKQQHVRQNLDGCRIGYPDGNFDVVFSHQVLEHVMAKDHLLEECYRVLAPGGLFVLSTENIGSIDNILALMLGQEPFCQHTGRYNLGNRFSPHFRTDMGTNALGHRNVNSYWGLKRMVEHAGFGNVGIRSIGNLCGALERLMPWHNRLLVTWARKEAK